MHNILQYQGNSDYEYNFEILGEAFFAMYLLGFGLPAAIAFVMKSIGKFMIEFRCGMYLYPNLMSVWIFLLNLYVLYHLVLIQHRIAPLDFPSIWSCEQNLLRVQEHQRRITNTRRKENCFNRFNRN